jgi:hypothetical protein
MTSRRNGRRSCQLLTYSYGRATQPLRRERPTQRSGSAYRSRCHHVSQQPYSLYTHQKRPKKVTSCAEGTKCVCAPRSTCIFTPPCAPSTAYSLVSSVRSPSPVLTESNLGRDGFVPGCSELPTEAGENLRSVNVASVIGDSGSGIEIISVDNMSYPVLEVLRKEGLEWID